jgi:hypothetical protein
MLSIAFKEWAVICRALAEGRQSLILRKGGIAESNGEFRPEHSRFLLYPTYFHEQQRSGIKPELMPLLGTAESEKPPAGIIRFAHFADVAAVHRIEKLEAALALDTFHGWTSETVEKRFHYRDPGLFALVVRVHRLPFAHEVVERSEYTGCKSWVQLDPGIIIDEAKPVLDDESFAHIVESITSLTHQS